MKLFYYKDRLGNFGDDLNPLIWYSLYPKLFTDSSNDTVVGIGTLINDRAPDKGALHVLGSGVGYHGSAKIDSRWNFVFVRGPRSCSALGLDPVLAITDPAILVRRIFESSDGDPDRGIVSYMPHHASCTFANWREICLAAGVQYLDPLADVSETIHRIRRSKLVIAEAMHAAIVADAVRVPWVAVKAYPHILDFKWIDWCESIGVEYAPFVLPSIWDMEQFHTPSAVAKSNLKNILISLGVSSTGWTPPLQSNNREAVFSDVVAAIGRLADSAPPFLSRDSVHNGLIGRVEDRIDQFIRKYT